MKQRGIDSRAAYSLRSVAAIILTVVMISGCEGKIDVERTGDTTAGDTTSGAVAGADRDTVVEHDTVVRHDTVVEPAPGDRGDNGSDKTPPTSSRNIRVEQPQPNTVVRARFQLSGTARTFENTVNWRLLDASGRKIAEDHFMANGEMGKFGPYSVMVEIPSGYSGRATLEVFQYSAKDGTPIDIVRIPLTVAAATGGTDDDGRDVQIFMTNSRLNPGTDCAKVFSAQRSAGRTVAVAEAALRQLLAGPSAAEQAQGYGTEIPSGTELRSIRIDNGVARADFSARLNAGAGSCSVGAARAQIERTLRQFSTVRSVVISVEGKTGDVLQP